MTTGTNAPASGMGSKTQQARERATEVGQEATRASGEVAQQAAGQGKQVAAEAGRQARDLVGEASAQVRQQAGTQQKRAVDGLRTLGMQLQSMASKSEQDGMAKEVVCRASDAAERAAGWLEAREPGDMVNEVRDYARQHPGAFLSGAAVAGLLVGRMARSLTAGGDGRGGARQPAQGEQAGGMPPVPSTQAPHTELPARATASVRTPESGVNR
jgi:hypothetical protein